MCPLHCSACSAEKKTEMATLTSLIHYTAIDLRLHMPLFLSCEEGKQNFQICSDTASPPRPSMMTTGTGHACSRHLTSNAPCSENRLSLSDLSLSLHLLILIPILREPLLQNCPSQPQPQPSPSCSLYCTNHARTDGARWLAHTHAHLTQCLDA